MKDGLLFRRGFNQEPLRCIAGDGVARVFKEVHLGDCDKHQGNSRIFRHIIHLGYYWPIMELILYPLFKDDKQSSSIVIKLTPHY